MQKWEYCYMKGIGHDGTHLYPSLTFFTSEGEKVEKLGGKGEAERVAQRIAQLGLDGWEIIAVAPFGTGVYKTIFFKRPISN